MNVVQLLAEQDRLLQQAREILMQDRTMSEEDFKQVEALRDKVLDIHNQLERNPFFHPETINVGYLH